MRDDALLHAVEHTNIFAEVDPSQKERLILALKKRGHVVGYMGDGINDAPALHAADVSISVDTAVDVAKEAADFVLLKQDLDILREGIDEGRRTFANTLKYVLTTISANFGNMFSMAGASALLPFLPLLAPQILLNNFLSDIPATTIASDNVDPEWVERPRRWDTAFIRDYMVLFGLVSSIFDFLTFGALWFLFHAAPAEFRTGWFIEFAADRAGDRARGADPARVLQEPSRQAIAEQHADRDRGYANPALSAVRIGVRLRAIAPAAAALGAGPDGALCSRHRTCEKILLLQDAQPGALTCNAGERPGEGTGSIIAAT